MPLYSLLTMRTVIYNYTKMDAGASFGGNAYALR
jgi:hypothetical protein